MKSHIPTFNDFVNENIRPDQIEKVSKDLAYSMPNHTKPDADGKFTEDQILKAFKYIPDLKYVKDKKDIQSIVDKTLTIVNESMSDIDILAQESKDFKDFVKKFKKEYADIAKAGTEKELEVFLKSIFDNSSRN
jgi:hypothetical protein